MTLGRIFSPSIIIKSPLSKFVVKTLNKQVGCKALLINKSFSSLLIGCVRRPTPRTDKGSSSITDNMINFNGISVLNFKFKSMFSLTKLLYVIKFYFQCIMYYLQLSDWRYSILSKVPFHLLHIKKLLLKP